MSTSTRMLRLLSLLQTHRYWPGGELARRLEVSPRTVRRDVDRLRQLGYPVEADRGLHGGYQLRPGAALPPLLLDDEEAVAVAVSLVTAAGGSVAGIEDSSLRALAKLISVLPPRLRGHVDAVRAYTVPSVPFGPTVNADTLSILARACRDAERLRFAYSGRGRPPGERTVEPHRLVAHGRRWYLVAWDPERGDWRTFRVDRLADPTTTGAWFRRRELPGGDPAAFVRASIAAPPPRYDVLVAIEAPAAHVRGIVTGWGTVEDVTPDSCRLRMLVDSLAWPVMALSAIDADFRVLRPLELTEHLRQMGRRFVRAAPTDTSSPPFAKGPISGRICV